MPKLLTGLASLALLLFASGCATSREPITVPVVQVPEVPSFLTRPLPAPTRQVTHNRDLLQLLADYESLRRRANADREAVADLLSQPGSAGED